MSCCGCCAFIFCVSIGIICFWFIAIPLISWVLTIIPICEFLSYISGPAGEYIVYLISFIPFWKIFWALFYLLRFALMAFLSFWIGVIGFYGFAEGVTKIDIVEWRKSPKIFLNALDRRVLLGLLVFYSIIAIDIVLILTRILHYFNPLFD